MRRESRNATLVQAPTHVIIKDKDEDDVKLTKDEIERVGDLARKRRLRNIEIEEARLLFETVGKTITRLQPGARLFYHSHYSRRTCVREVHTWAIVSGVVARRHTRSGTCEVAINARYGQRRFHLGTF